MSMRKMVIVCAAIAVLCAFAGCGNVGEAPFPTSGPRSTSAVVLYKNGSVYRFDYTAQYDGIALEGYSSAKKDSVTGDIVRGPFSSMSSKVQDGGAPAETIIDGKNYGGIFKTKGLSVFEFSHHKQHNVAETWIFTLFNEDSLIGNDWKSVSFWAKYVGDVANSSVTSNPTITLRITSSNGFRYGEGSVRIPSARQNDGEWQRYSIPLNHVDKNIMAATDRVKEWRIGTPTNAGHLYVDEIILER